MDISKISFWFFIYFVVGVALFGFGVSILIILILSIMMTSILAFIFLFKENKKCGLFIILPMFIFGGAFYYAVWNDYHFNSVNLLYGEKTEIFGDVTSFPRGLSTKSFNIKTENGYILQVRTKDYNNILYGSKIALNGVIEKIEDEYKYLRVDKIVGSINYPDVEVLKSKNGHIVMNTLYNIREKFVDVFDGTLSIKNSNLMSGILLGKNTANFSKEFKDSMKGSGTTHIVALSGYNVMILVDMIFMLFALFLSRKWSAPIAIIIIILFVAMTGSDASVVRAAIMGILVVLAEMTSRVYNFAHASSATAFVMILANPSILQFDIGFMLSFMALFGIIYGAGIIYKPTGKKGLLVEIKKTFAETFSAQILVLPILAMSFGQFSVVSLISNMLILPFVPITMGLGFIEGVIGMIWMPFANIFSMLLSPFLSFFVWVIETLGKFGSINISWGIVPALVYYIIIGLLMMKLYNESKQNEYRA